LKHSIDDGTKTLSPGHVPASLEREQRCAVLLFAWCVPLLTDNTNTSVWVPRLANGSPRTGCRGCALALGSFLMLSPKSAHGLLVTPESWVSSKNAPKRQRGGIGWSKTNEAVGHVGAEGRQRPRGRGWPARWRRGTRYLICSSPLRAERERRGYRQETVRAQASRSARLRSCACLPTFANFDVLRRLHIPT
jgi:hypothetical protein